MALAVVTRGWALVLLPVLYFVGRVSRSRETTAGGGLSPAMGWIYAGHCLGCKFPQVVGQVKFWWRRARRAPNVIIEHKEPCGNSIQVSPQPSRERIAPA